MLITLILSILLSFFITVAVSKKGIPVLVSKKLNQPIYEIGPRWHKSKAGTPTMGGLFFIAGITITASLICLFRVNKEQLPGVFLTLGMALLFALIGFIDDRAKLLKKENEGLKAHQKFILQLAAASLYLGLMRAFGGLETTLSVPFSEIELELGIWYYVIALILLVGINNSVNLTDGIDGLASTVTAVIAVFFIVFALRHPQSHESIPSLAYLSGALFGGCLGFLVYNWNPARVFMGDTGSLFLGGFTAGLAFLANEPLVILVIGLWFIIETVSVMLQVGCYKLTKKRIFKMAPIHHHFEKCGWSEVKIVVVAAGLTAVLSIVTYFLL